MPLSLAQSSKLACRPVGECERCPPHLVGILLLDLPFSVLTTRCHVQRNEPVCRVHANRRPVHCIVLDEADLPQQQNHGAPPTTNGMGSGAFVKRPPKHPIVELPPRPATHPHLLDNVDKYIAANDESGQKNKDQGPVKRQSSPGSRDGSSKKQQQTFATWEPCVRAIEAERKDYWEFVLANLGFAAVALFIVIVRGRMIAARHYNQVVNLIGFKPLQQLWGSESSATQLPGRSGLSGGV